MKRCKHVLNIVALASILFFAACSDTTIVNNSEEELNHEAMTKSATEAIVVPKGAAIEGKVIVKMRKGDFEELKFSQQGTVQMNSFPSPLTAALTSIKATGAERLFPPAGRFEERTKREGLDRWLVIDFDKSVDVQTAVNAMHRLNKFECVEYSPVIQLHSTAPASLFGIKRPTKMPFNDPLLDRQWHYNNTGSLPGSVEGSDIDLFEAWKITTGSPNVIVCVVDGGIDVTHPDLVDNLWVNEKEKNGTPGVDDDGNGYIDDVNGFCFVRNTGKLLPDQHGHGTHVAGTIAARNNNGIGVGGVAGGDGTPGSGVRLMSAAIFREASSSGNAPAAIKYGADNGAVICQNSWGYDYGVMSKIPESLKEAIDYFVKYAGCDNDGNQLPTSPMKGGVVTFSAGNQHMDYKEVPASYDKVIAVAAMGPNFERASYSNYGSWVDIFAPGGDQDRFSNKYGVLSTVCPYASQTDGQSYGFYQGTSMACPHVSGVLALIISKFGGQGFTNEMCKRRLFATVSPVDIDEKNPDYRGKLGAGLVDAYLAVSMVDKHKAPEKPVFDEEKSSRTDFTSISLYWKVPKDEDDDKAAFFALYMSEKELSKDNYKKDGTLIDDMIKVGTKQAGDEMQFVVDELKTGTKYYFALEAYDRWGNMAEPTMFAASTKVNTPPVIDNLPKEPITLLDVLGKLQYDFEVVDIDGHSWTFEAGGDLKGVSLKQTDKGITLTLRPVLDEGDYTFTLKLTDELGASSEYTIPFYIVAVKTPEIIKPLPVFVLGVENDPVSVNLREFFKGQEHLTLKFTATSQNQSVATATLSDEGVVTIKGVKPGRTSVRVEANNGYERVESFIAITVTQDANRDVYAVWPIPMGKELNIWVNPRHSEATVKLLSVTGEKVLDERVKVDKSGVGAVKLKDITSGPYTLKIDTDGGEQYVRSVVKK